MVVRSCPVFQRLDLLVALAGPHHPGPVPGMAGGRLGGELPGVGGLLRGGLLEGGMVFPDAPVAGGPTVFSTCPARLCHRCHRSATWIACGAPARAPSA